MGEADEAEGCRGGRRGPVAEDKTNREDRMSKRIPWGSPNKREGICTYCGKKVPAGKGLIWWQVNCWKVAHADCAEGETRV